MVPNRNILFFGDSLLSFRLYGTRVSLDWSVIISFAMVVLFTWLSIGSVLIGLYVYVVTTVSVIMHEFGHIAAARRYGYDCSTVRITVFGGMAFINADNTPPLQEVVIAICGPLVNLFIFVLLAPLAFLSEIFGLDFLSGPIFVAMIIQFVIFLFNVTLLAPPADGGRIARGLLCVMTNSLRSSLNFLWFLSFASVIFWLFVFPFAFIPIIFIFAISIYENMRYSSSIFGPEDTLGRLFSAIPMGGSHAMVEDGDGGYAVVPVTLAINRMTSASTYEEAVSIANTRLIDFALRNACSLKKIRPERVDL